MQPGEHGVGLGKRKYLALEHGAVAVDAMRALKTALDGGVRISVCEAW